MDASRSRRSALRIPGTLVVTTAALALANMSGAAAATAEMRVPAECTGGNAIGMSLDSSGSVQQEFPTISRQIAAFVDSTSGLMSSATANDNQYYVNTFSSEVTDSTGAFAVNDGGAVSDAVAALSPRFGGTDIREGIKDLTREFGNTQTAGAGIAIIFTDGQATSAKKEADALRAIGVTVAAVGIGSLNMDVLDEIASERDDGSKILFTGDTFEEISYLFSSVIQSIDSDGDGVDDCADGCPEDPDKIDPGVCGCGVPEGCSIEDLEDLGMPDVDMRGVGTPQGGAPGVYGSGAAGSYGI